MLKSIKTFTTFHYYPLGFNLISIVFLLFINTRLQGNDTLRWNKILSQSLYEEGTEDYVDSLSEYFLNNKQYESYIENILLKISYKQIKYEHSQTQFYIKNLKDSVNIFHKKKYIDLKTYENTIIRLEQKEAMQMYQLEKFESSLTIFNNLIKKIEKSNLDSLKKIEFNQHCNMYIASIYCEMDRYNEALPLYRSILNLFEKDPLSSVMVAQLFQKIGDTINAELFYKKAKSANTFINNHYLTINSVDLGLLKYDLQNKSFNRAESLIKRLKQNTKNDINKFSLELLIYKYHIENNELKKAKNVLFSINLPKKTTAASSIKLNQTKAKYFIQKRDYKSAEQFLQMTFDTLKINNIESIGNENMPLNNIDQVLESLSLGLEIKNKKLAIKPNPTDIQIGENYAEEIYKFIIDSRSKIRSDLDKKFSSENYENFYNRMIEFAYLSKDNKLLWKYLAMCNNYSISFTRLYRSYQSEKNTVAQYDKYYKLYNSIIDLEIQEKLYPDSNEVIKKLIEQRIEYDEGGKIDTINSIIENRLNQSVSLENIQNQISKNACLVSFYTTDDYIYKLNITSEEVVVLKTNIQNNIIEDLECLSNKNCAYHQPVSNLSTLISDLNLKENVTIIPHGILNCVPFEALNGKDGKTLIHKHTISYLYNWQQKIEPSEYATSISAIAPFFEEPCSDFTHLANNTIESRQISETLKIDTTVISENISKEKFFEECLNTDILHFASHTKIDNSSPYKSFLSLGENCAVDKASTKIYTTDILKQNLSNKLIVLSSCDSGNGKILKGEGLESLAKAFFSSEVKSIISTLWKANDASSSEIMQGFYEELNKGKPKGESLRIAKINFLDKHGPEYYHPYYWAGFVPFGDMSPIIKPTYNILPYIIGFLVVLILIYFFKKTISGKGD